MLQIISLAFLVVFIVIQLLIINYLMKLEKIGCACAMDWRRNYIIAYFVVSILYAIIAPLLDPKLLPIIQTVYVVFGIINVVYVIQYVHRLKREKCACSESVYREVMYVVSIFNAIVYSFLLSLIVFLMFTLATFASKVDTKGRSLGSYIPTKKPTSPVKSIKKILKRK
jgi:hypothetical protein